MLIASRTHDFGKQPIKELAPMLKNIGIDSAQLVLPKGFTEIQSYEDITPEILTAIKQSFEQSQVKIHILGCYMDLGNPDKQVRENAVETFKKCLSYGKIIGADIVGTETAYPRLTKAEKRIWYPYMMDSIARLVEEAEGVGQDMALEPVYWHPLEDLETTIRVFEKMNSRRLKMIFDPANVLEYPEIDQGAYWNEWLQALGKKIAAIHMKDFIEGPNKKYQSVDLGDGVMDYTEILDWTKKHKPDIVVVREEIRPESAKKDISYMKSLWGNSR